MKNYSSCCPQKCQVRYDQLTSHISTYCFSYSYYRYTWQPTSLVAVTTSAIVSTQPETSGLTQAISTLAISSSTQPQTAIASSQKHLLVPLSAPFSPVANHTRSRHQHPIVAQSSTSPTLLQSQARALPITYSSHQVASPAFTHTDPPALRVSLS